jgi:hypothetical protein
VSYSGRRCGAASRSSTAATAGPAPHSTKTVAGQSLDGWLATVENTVAQTGSRDSTPVRSQTIPSGRAARSFSSSRWIPGAVKRLIGPVRATTMHPSRIVRSIRNTTSGVASP